MKKISNKIKELKKELDEKNLKNATAAYAAIVEEVAKEYTDGTNAEFIRQEHPEINFMDEEKIEKLLEHAKNERRRNKMKIGILNCAICTEPGEYSFEKSSLEEVKKLLQKNDFISAIGHQSTAEVLTELTGIDIPMNRIQFSQKPGQIAIVFRLLGRIPEGKILSREEIEEIGYEFCTLTRK